MLENLSLVDSASIPQIVPPTNINYFSESTCNCNVGNHEAWNSPNKAPAGFPGIMKASGGINITIVVTQSAGPATCTSCAKYHCLFLGGSGNNFSVAAAGGTISGSSSTFSCAMPNWGASFPAEPIQVFLYKGNGIVPYTSDGTPFLLYIEEQILSVSKPVLDAAGVTITITGSGFRPAATYKCFLFGPAPADPTAPPASPATAWPRWAPLQTVTALGQPGFAGLQGPPFNVTGTTAGACSVAWPYEATPAFLTVLHDSAAFDALQASGRRPRVRGARPLPRQSS